MEDDYNLKYYGEMVPTLFNWMTADEQRRRIKEVEERLKQKNSW